MPNTHLLGESNVASGNQLIDSRSLENLMAQKNMTIIAHFFGLKSDPICSSETNHHFIQGIRDKSSLACCDKSDFEFLK